MFGQTAQRPQVGRLDHSCLSGLITVYTSTLPTARSSKKFSLRYSFKKLRKFRLDHVMIALGSDHGGVELKDFLAGVLRSKNIDVQDFGTQGRESVDYPDFGRQVSQQVSRGVADRGILICTTGIGMSILANKYPGIRAALVQDLETARTSREHNDINILVLAGAKTDRVLARQILEIWLQTPFAGGRHQRRVDKISEIERALGTSTNRRTGKNAKEF